MRVSVLFDDKSVKNLIAQHEKEAVERINRLTKTQRQVLPLIVGGLLNKTVAYELGLSQRTIENHRKALMDRTGCKTLAQLIRLSVLAGIEV